MVSVSDGLELFRKFGMPFTGTENIEKSCCHDGDFPVSVRHEINV